MKLQYLRRALMVLSLLFLLLLGLIAAQGATPPISISFSRVMDFGMVGITVHQTARLNVVNLSGTVAGSPTTSSSTPVSPCKAELMFLDNTGKTFINTAGQPIDTLLTLAPGQSGSLDLNADGLQGNIGSRVEVHAVIKDGVQQPAPLNSVFSCFNVPTLEVFDNATGKTTALFSNAVSSLSVGPLQVSAGSLAIPVSLGSQVLSFGMLGITRDQEARLNAVYVQNASVVPLSVPSASANPSQISVGLPQHLDLAFVDSNGNAILDGSGQPIKKSVTLNPGESGFLDLNSTSSAPPRILFDPEGRAEVRGVINVVSPSPLGSIPVIIPQTGVLGTLEVFNSLDNKTTVVLPAVQLPTLQIRLQSGQ